MGMVAERRAVIAGGGIGGLASGVALGRAGFDVQVLERAPSLEPLGAGLSLWPNAVHALRALDLGEVADAPGVPRGGGALRRADGSVLASYDPAEIERRYGAPLVGVHRGDLQQALVGALGPEKVRCDAGVSGLAPEGVRLCDGSVLEADLVVGADGLHSVIREHVAGAADPRESGIVAYRGVVEQRGDVPAGERWGAGSVAGLLPLSGDRVYWYVAFMGDATADQGELRERAGEYASPVPEIVAATDPEAVLCHVPFDRPPPERMAAGNAALVGDAAHPMLPFLGQGACSALEDAVALGSAVAAEANLDLALAAYEAERLPRAATLVKGSRAASRAALAQSAAVRAVRNAAVRALPASMRMRQLDRVIEG